MNITAFIVCAFLAMPAFAQHEHHGSQAGENGPSDTTAPAHNGHLMSHAYSRNLPMNRNGSGTSWLPDHSPVFGHMYHAGKWMLMSHYNVFARANFQNVFNEGKRNGNSFDMPFWYMLMGQRPVKEKGLFHFSLMLSPEFITIGNAGYPLLFQSGETYLGQRLVDRQHPHDLFSELSVSYSHSFNTNSDLYVYFGLPGEPALGPVAFMHRPSSLINPNSPLGHHWQDATHITYGVSTVGYRYRDLKIEGSAFRGREPDEKRYDIEAPKFDSWSGRLFYSPTRSLVMQVSQAFIKSPEPLEPESDVKRSSASVIYTKPLPCANSFFSSTIAWGYNYISSDHKEHSVLAEAVYQLKGSSFFTRAEWVQKSNEELNIPEDDEGHHHVNPFASVTMGATQNLFKVKDVVFAAGGHVTLNRAIDELEYIYGKDPVSLQVYLRIYPDLLK